MEASMLEESIENRSGFTLNVELKELTTNGVVNFASTKEKINVDAFWNGEKLIFPVYGVYKVSWGFYQNSINTFYKDTKTELALIVNEEMHEEKASITTDTPCFHAVKSSHKTFTFLFREKETLSLKVNAFNIENPKIKDVYLKVEKLYIEGNNEFGYES
jgi:hypothetical protein